MLIEAYVKAKPPNKPDHAFESLFTVMCIGTAGSIPGINLHLGSITLELAIIFPLLLFLLLAGSLYRFLNKRKNYEKEIERNDKNKRILQNKAKEIDENCQWDGDELHFKIPMEELWESDNELLLLNPAEGNLINGANWFKQANDELDILITCKNMKIELNRQARLSDKSVLALDDWATENFDILLRETKYRFQRIIH